MDPVDDLLEVIKECSAFLRKRLNPEDTVPYMYSRKHFTESEKDKIRCINRNDGREPANDELLNIVAAKPESLITLVASLKVNNNEQLFNQMRTTVRRKIPGLSDQIVEEVNRLEEGLSPDLKTEDNIQNEKSYSSHTAGVEVLHKSEMTMSQSSPAPIRAENQLQKLETQQLSQQDSLDDNKVVLDDYNSDLHLRIDPDRYEAEPLTNPPGFCYCWAGVRATHGVCRGKAYYEVKLKENLPVEFGSDHKEPYQQVFRVGWSLDTALFQLGEAPDSYGFGSTGKFSYSNEFMDYGETFEVEDVIGALLDLESQPPSISFTKNGRSLGVAKRLGGYQVSERDQALFPHILTKNIRFEVNFGQQTPWFPPATDFMYIMQFPVSERIRGLKPPDSQSACEIIMIIGLPGAGKTTWANKKLRDNPHMRYNILGTDILIDKMKVLGLKRQFNFQQRFEELIHKASKCLIKLLEIASKMKRNFILDQTNLYPSARKRKMQNFCGFMRRAAVILPDDPELIRRAEKRTSETGKSVPDKDHFKMKAHFKLPWEKDDSFDNIEYTELPEEKASLLVKGYNREGSFKMSQYNQEGRQAEQGCARCGGKAGSECQQPLCLKQGSASQEPLEIVKQPVVQNTQLIRTMSTPAAVTRGPCEQFVRSNSASPAVHSYPSLNDFGDMELDDVDDKVITRLGEELSKISEHSKQFWELILPVLDVKVTMGEKKKIRRSRGTGVAFLELLGDKNVKVGQLIQALKAAGLSEFCHILLQETDPTLNRLSAETHGNESYNIEMVDGELSRTGESLKHSETVNTNDSTEERSIKHKLITKTVVRAVSASENTAAIDLSTLQDSKASSSLCSLLSDSDKENNLINACGSQSPAGLQKSDLETSTSKIDSGKSQPLFKQTEAGAATCDPDNRNTVQNTDIDLRKFHSGSVQQQNIVSVKGVNVSNNDISDKVIPLARDNQAVVTTEESEGKKTAPNGELTA